MLILREKALTMNAREFLDEIQMLDQLISNKTEELLQLRTIATSCTVPTDRDGSVSSGVSDKVGNLVAQICELEKQILDVMGDYLKRRKECIEVIESVRPPIFYTILHRYHIQYKSLVQIAEEIGYEYHYVCDLHRKAVAEVQRILDERE